MLTAVIQKAYVKGFNYLYRFTGPIPDRVRNVLLFLCCACLVSVYFFYTGEQGKGEVEVFCSAVLVLAAVLSIDREMNRIEWNGWVLYPMILFGTGLIAIGLIHPLGEGFFTFAVDLILIFPAFYFIWINRGDHETLFRIISAAVIAAGILSFIYCVALSITGGLVIIDGRVAGFKSNVNFLGMMGIGMVMAGLYLLAEYYSIRSLAALSSMSIGIGLSYVIESASRTSLIAVLICILAFIIYEIRIHRQNGFQRKNEWPVIAIAVCLLMSSLLLGVNLDTVNNKVLSDRGAAAAENPTAAESLDYQGTIPGDLPDRLNMKSGSADKFSSGRLTIWRIYVQNTTLLGRPHDYVKEKLKEAPGTRAHNNFIEYNYRCGIIVGSIYLLFYAAAGIFGLRFLFFGSTERKYGLFTVMNVGAYAVSSLLEIAFLPFMRIVPCLFFLSIAPLMVKNPGGAIMRGEKQGEQTGDQTGEKQGEQTEDAEQMYRRPTMKKLLILGGAALHCGVIETARSMGIETYVTDYLSPEDSPGKRIADHNWDYDVLDCDSIVSRCREEGIEGVLNVYIDPCQLPYQEICGKLGLPCFATPAQYDVFTDKKRFLNACRENGVDIIQQYSESDFTREDPEIPYPLYVKPSDSRGSRGQAVCRSYHEVRDAIAAAKKESGNGEVVIERFMEGFQDIQLTYFVIDGEPHLYCVADKYNGTAEEGYQGSVTAGICPSFNQGSILSDAHPKICAMLRKLGLKNTPVFIQGFLEGGILRVYDPALRLPGFLYEHNLRKATGLDVYRSLINFAFTGSFLPELKEVESKRNMSGKLSVNVWVFIRAGRITEVRGIDELGRDPAVTRIDERYRPGSVIEDWRDIRNNYCEIAMVCDDVEEAKCMIRRIYDTIHITDGQGEDMKIVFFDADRLDEGCQK